MAHSRFLHPVLVFTACCVAGYCLTGCAGSTLFARHGATATDKDVSSSSPSLSQLLDGAELLKLRSPADYATLQSALEDSSMDIPPAYRQAYMDQYTALLQAQQERQAPITQPEFPQTTIPSNVTSVDLTPQPQLPQQPQPQPQPAPVVSVPNVQHTALPSPISVATQQASLLATPSQSAISIGSARTNMLATPAPVEQLATSATHSQVVPASAIASVHPAAAPIVSAPGVTQAAVTAKTPEELHDWGLRIEQALVGLNQELAQPNLSREERTRLEIRRRMLFVLTNQRDEAASPIDQLDEDEREYVKHQMHALSVWLDVDGKHPTTRRAALALRDLRAATSHLANVSTLDVSNLTFCKEVLSYGEYRVFDSYGFRPKDEVVLYVEIDNFAAHSRKDSFETELRSSYEILDDAGRRVANVVLPVDKQLSNNRRRDYFIAYLITMPTQIAPGSYRLQLTVEDVIGKKSNYAAIDFRIQ